MIQSTILSIIASKMQSQSYYAQSRIDFSTIPSNVPSMCIPRVFSNIPEIMIRKTFEELCLGEIGQIKRIPTKDDKYKCVRIVFNKWYTNDNANLSRERLLNGKEIKVIYDEPWFWKVYAYKSNNNHQSSSAKQGSVTKQNSSIPIAPTLAQKFYVQDNRVTQNSIAPCLSDSFCSPNTAFIKYRKPQPQKPAPMYKRSIEPRTPSNSPPRKREEGRKHEQPNYLEGPSREGNYHEENYHEEEEVKYEVEDEHQLRQIENEKHIKEDCYVEVDYGDVQMPPRRKFKWEK